MEYCAGASATRKEGKLPWEITGADPSFKASGGPGFPAKRSREHWVFKRTEAVVGRWSYFYIKSLRVCETESRVKSPGTTKILPVINPCTHNFQNAYDMIGYSSKVRRKTSLTILQEFLIKLSLFVPVSCNPIVLRVFDPALNCEWLLRFSDRFGQCPDFFHRDFKEIFSPNDFILSLGGGWHL